MLIHHNQWMYDRLWWVKKYYPSTQVVDTLHILEYRWHGGFPVQAVRYDKFIDLHHVISPQLEDWMVRVQGIEASKVVDAPLAGLTAGNENLVFKRRREGAPFTVAFVGRMNRQKRPDAFVLLAERLGKTMPGVFRFILHGSGDIDGVIESLLGTCTGEFLNKATALIKKMNEDDAARESLWSKECGMLADFNKLESANHLFTRLLTSWK